MTNAFWESVGSRLAERWAGIAGPTLVFWLGASLAYAWHLNGITALATRVAAVSGKDPTSHAVAIVVALTTVATSAVVLQWAVDPALRLLAGYWPGVAGPLRERLVWRLVKQAVAEDRRWQEVRRELDSTAAQVAEAVAPFEADGGETELAGRRTEAAKHLFELVRTHSRLLSENSRLERRGRGRPSRQGYLLPTRTGNILRAAEMRPENKYGLNAAVLWPRLWPALPEFTRRDVLAARIALEQTVTMAVWGSLFCLVGFFAWWAVPLGLAVLIVSVRVVVPERARVYGDLLEAAFDQHRFTVYQQLRWPLPSNPATEVAEGRRLTSYLRRGSDAPLPLFTDQSSAGQPDVNADEAALPRQTTRPGPRWWPGPRTRSTRASRRR